MAINGGRIDYTVGFKTDTNGLSTIKKQLADLSNINYKDFLNVNPTNLNTTEQELEKIKGTVKEVESAYNEAFDSTTGITNIDKLSKSLSKIGTDNIYNDFKKLGPAGIQAFNNISQQVSKVNLKFKETNNFLTKMGETLTNTIKWGISSSLMNKFVGSVQQAYGYVQHLDTSLNDIRIVTGKSADEMDKFAEKANKAAQALGSSTTEYTEAALIYYQQGLSDEEAQARAETTLKAANVTGQTGKQVSEELTAVWNGYKVTAEETEKYVDKLAAVAATSASNLEELSTGMSKVASAANAMGVDVDQLNAQLSTIISVTRQAPETAGTALKTIYARMEDLKIDGETEDGVKLGEVSSTLDEVGVHIMDVNGDIRDLGEVIEEVGNKWYTWTEAQQSAIAQAIAGKRQYNNLLALFNNWEQYNKELDVSRNATGTLQQQQDTYMESTAAHIQQLKTEWEDFYDSLLNTDDINSILDILTAMLDKVGKLLDSIGGGKTALTGLIGILTRIPAINNIISKEIGNILSKTKNTAYNTEQWNKYEERTLSIMKEGTAAYKERENILRTISQYGSLVTDRQKEEAKHHIDILNKLSQEKDLLDSQLKDAQSIAQLSIQRTQTNRLGKDINELAPNIDNNLSSTNSLRGISDIFDAQRDSIEEIKIALNQYTKELESTIAIKQEWDKALKNGLITEEEYEQDLKGLVQDLRVLRKESKLGDNLSFISPAAQGEVKAFIELISKLELKLSKSSETANKFTNSTKQIEKSFEDMSVAVSENQQHVLNNLSSLPNAIQENAEALDDAKDAANDYMNTLQSEAKGQGVTNLIQGLSSIAFAMQSLSNIGNIINDDNLTNFEKFSQITTALLLSLPMLKSGLTGLADGFYKLTGPLVANIAAEKGLITADGLAKASGAALIGVKEGERVKTEALTAALLKEKAVMLLTNPVFIAMAIAVAAVTGAIIAENKAHKEQIEAISSANSASIEASKTKQEERKAYEDTAKSLQTLISQYKEGTVSQEEFNEQKTELLANLDAEGRAALNISDNWKEATQALTNYRAALAKQNAEEAENRARMGAENALIAADEGEGKYDTSTQTFSNKGYRALLQATVGASGILTHGGLQFWDKDYQKSLEQISYYLQDTKTKIEDVTDEAGNLQLDMNNPQSIIDFVNAVDNASQAGVKLSESITKQAAEIRNSASYADMVADVDLAKSEKEKAYGEESGINLASTLEEGQVAYNKFTEDLIKNEGYTLQEASNAWVKYLSGLDTEVSKQMIDVQTNFDTMTSAFASKFQGEFKGSKFEEEANEVLQYLMDNNLTEGIHLFTPEEWEDMIIGDMSTEEIAQLVSQKLEESYEQGFELFKETAGEKEDSFQSIIEEAISGSVETGDDSTYSALKGQLDELLKYYPELQEEVDTFNNESIIGTQKWIDSVYTLKDAYNDLEFDKLVQDYSNSLEKLHQQVENLGEERVVTTEERDENGQLKTTVTVEPDTRKFTDTVSDIMDSDYSITIEIEGDVTDDFENLVDSMEDMDSMAEKIGEDFIVSAEDITEIAAAYPGILEGYTDLGNGTIQLNKDIAESAMNAASQAEIASTEELVTEIENTNKKLKVKKNHYQTVVDIANKAADGEIDAQKAMTDISAELDKIEEVNNDLKSQEVENNAADVADNSAVNAGIVSDNWGQAYNNMASDAIEAAKTAISAAEAVANNDAEALDSLSSDVSATWSGGSKGTSSSINTGTSSYKSGSDTADSDYFKQVASDAQTQIDALDKQIAANEAMAVEASARLGKSVTTNTTTGDKTSDSSDSSSSEQEAETEEYLEREEDLYRAINEELDDIESTLGRIEKTQDHSWGLSYKNTLEDQNELLKDQLELLEKKKDTYEDDLSTRRKQLEDQGVTFSEDGSVMTNAETRLNELYDEYNSMVDTYNSMTASQQEAYSSTLEAQKDTIDNIEDAIDDYESAYSDYNSVLDELLDTHYELIENEVNQFNADVEIHLELADAEDTWNDFWYDVVQDVDDTDFGGKIAKSFSKLSTLTGENGTINELTHHLNDVVAEVDKQIAGADIGGGDSIFGDDTELSKETLIDYRDKLIDAVTTAKENIDDMVDTYLDTLDDAKDKIDEQIEGWETVGDHIEHNIELIKLVSGDEAYNTIGKQYEQMYENNLSLVRDAKSGMDFWQERMNYYQQQMTSAQTEAERENFEQFYEKAKENYTDAVKTLDSSLTNAIEKRKDAFLNAASEVADKMDKAFSKGMGISGVKNEWDLAIEKQEHYLDNVERSLAMEELDGIFKDILDDMDARSDKQQEFLKFQDEEIAKLNEREKLTQYDIDELKARLEIKKQELALEEAQQNKSNLRLRRDSQGNYSYQYTADEDTIDDAQDGLLNARQEWYELVKKRNQETAEAVIEIRTRALEVMEERSQALADKDLARAEELTMTLKALQDEEKYYMQDAEKAKRDFFWGTAEFFEDVEQNTILPMWNTTIEQMIDEFVENGEDSFVGAVKTGISEVDKEQEKFVEDTDELLSTAGVNYKELVSTGIDPTTEALESLNQTEEEFNDTLDETIDLFGDLESNISEATAAYNELKDAAVGAIEEANRALNTLAATAVSAISQINSAISSAESATSLAASKAGTSSSGSGSGSGSSSGGSSAATVSYSLVGDPNGVSGTYGVRNDSTGTYVAIYRNKADAEAKLAELQAEEYKKIGIGSGTHQINIGTSTKTKVRNYARKNGITIKSYDTGGYTGDWGTTDGRLALLHQKELVLNEADTTNILTAVQSVRDLVKGNTVGNFSGIAESIASMAQAQVQTLAQVGSGMLQAIASMVNNSNSEVQNYRNMTVNADFSGVRSADAIYQALMELDNYGVQQAYSNAPSANKSY